MRSDDGGETWTDCSADLVTLAEQPHLKSSIGSDTTSRHAGRPRALRERRAAGTVVLALRMGLFRSEGGREWRTWRSAVSRR